MNTESRIRNLASLGKVSQFVAATALFFALFPIGVAYAANSSAGEGDASDALIAAVPVSADDSSLADAACGILSVELSASACTSEQLAVMVTLVKPADGTVYVYDASAGSQGLPMASIQSGQVQAAVPVQLGQAYQIIAVAGLESLDGMADESVNTCAQEKGKAFLLTEEGLRMAVTQTADQFNGEDGGYTCAYFTQTAASFDFDITCLNAASRSWGAFFSYAAYADPATGAERKATRIASASLMGNAAATWRCSSTGLRPDTTYELGYYSVYHIGGMDVQALPERIQVSTLPIAVAKPSVVKLSNKKVSITVNVPECLRVPSSFNLKVYANSTLVKTLVTDGQATQQFTYTKKKAASKKYRVVFALKSDASVSKTSGAVKPIANKKTFKVSSSASSYGYGIQQLVPTSMSYTSKGKLRAKVVWVNTALAKAKSGFKAKVTVTCQGKKIATQVFDSKLMQRATTKKQTLTFKKAKKGFDLVNGNLKWSVKVVKSY